MAIDDPGWGGFTSLPDEGGAAPAAAPAGPAAPPAVPGGMATPLSQAETIAADQPLPYGPPATPTPGGYQPPGPGGHQPGAPGGHQPPGALPPPPSSAGRPRPPWLIPAIAGGGVLLLIIIVVLATSGSHKSGPKSPATTPGPATVAPPTGSLSPAVYQVRADAICTATAPELRSAAQAQNPQAYAAGLASIVTQTRALGQPTQGADLARTYLTDLASAATAYNQGDTTNGSAFELQAATAAGQFGMKVCNEGR